MHFGEPAIVFPAPGLPLFAPAGRPRLELIADGHRVGLEDLQRWAAQLALREVGGGAVVPLEVESVDVVDGPPDPMVRCFAEVLAPQALVLVRLGLRPRQVLWPLPPRTVQLYDLVAADQVVRWRSVAVLHDRQETLTLAFASDLHLAAFWDAIWDAVGRHAPDLATRVLHPASLLDRFIQEANALHSRGELDVIVLGGDLVEYVYDGTRPGSSENSAATNVQALVEALTPLKVPTIAAPGNHDHRAFAWRGRTYGLAGVGVPASRTRAVLEAAGLWDPWRFFPADLDALRTVDRGGRPALAHFAGSIAPAVDFALTLGGVRLIFASTGCDVLARWRNVEWARWGLFMRNIRSAWHHPDSDGLRDEQVRSIASSLSSARRGGGVWHPHIPPTAAAIFFHAPLFHSAESAASFGRVLRLPLGPQEKLSQRAAFERRLQAAGIRSGVLFRNPGPMIEALASASGPVATFSGHVHRATAFELDRQTLTLRSFDPRAFEAGPQNVTLWTAPALCLEGSGENAQPGYLLARFEHGALRRLEVRGLRGL
ncbi:MAG: hypothetical protein A2V98_11795 [Planctomycetes bacterium RBG_16_64_12]|nr:MAG: hypothetical protein A2V98_11795 [Planctomycetes bacterium RBG_16_64_12]